MIATRRGRPKRGAHQPTCTIFYWLSPESAELVARRGGSPWVRQLLASDLADRTEPVTDRSRGDGRIRLSLVLPVDLADQVIRMGGSALVRAVVECKTAGKLCGMACQLHS